MSTYDRLQEVTKQKRTVGGIPVCELIRRMQTEGVEIAGLGAANLPLLTFLPMLGVSTIRVRDRRPPDPETAKLLSERGIPAIFGEGYLDGLSGVIFRTPSLRPDAPSLTAARERGAAVLGEMALFLALCPAKVFAVTGSDGKTTTAMMTEAILRTAGRRTHLGGNIGTPLLGKLPEIAAEDAVILELSSFQLSDLDPPCGRTAITNITENHLDWHTDMEEYVAAKARILGGGTAILNGDCEKTAALAAGRNAILFTENPPLNAHSPLIFREGNSVWLDDGKCERLFDEVALRLPGRHNLKNAMAAAGLALPYAPREAIEAALADFHGARHRCEFLGILDSVPCYDSSIDTTPARTAATLSSLREPPVVLLGGRGKNLPLAPLAECVTRRAVFAVLYGEEATAIAEALTAADPRFPFTLADDFEEAVLRAHALAKSNARALLLSPACTSFDLFSDYRQRGDAFAAICRRLSAPRL